MELGSETHSPLLSCTIWTHKRAVQVSPVILEVWKKPAKLLTPHPEHAYTHTSLDPLWYSSYFFIDCKPHTAILPPVCLTFYPCSLFCSLMNPISLFDLPQRAGVQLIGGEHGEVICCLIENCRVCYEANRTGCDSVLSAITCAVFESRRTSHHVVKEKSPEITLMDTV